METKELVEFDDVMKVDIRIGMIIESERIPKSDKLLKMTVQFDDNEFKVCVTNLGDKYEPDHFMGLIVPFVMNMPPRKMMGVETEVMICAGMGLNGNFDFELYKVGTQVL